MIPLEEIRVPYTLQPHMARWGGPHYNPQPCPVRIAYKAQQLEVWDTELWGMQDEPHILDLLHRACDFTATPRTDSVVEWALNFEEDVAIMHHGVLSALCFTSPSGWIPRSRLGQSLTAIHGAVPGAGKLADASARIAEVLCSGSYRRWVWTIASSSEHNGHPRVHRPHPRTVDDLYLRTEVQTSAPLGDGHTSLFWVRVDTTPLRDVFGQPGWRERIIDSVRSMSDTLLQYKGLVHIKELLK